MRSYCLQAKTRVAWQSADTLLIGTHFPGEDAAASLTDSGYPRTIREWRRGTPLEQAVEVFTLPSHCRHSTVTLPSHYRHITVTLPSHYRHIAVTLPSHYRHIAVTLPSHCRHIAVTLPRTDELLTHTLAYTHARMTTTCSSMTTTCL